MGLHPLTPPPYFCHAALCGHTPKYQILIQKSHSKIYNIVIIMHIIKIMTFTVTTSGKVLIYIN